MQSRKIALFVVLVMSVLFIGCMGNGGGNPAPVTKDVVGITSTIDGFMSSVVAKDPVVAGKFIANPLAQTASNVHTLMVYDFGPDINNPNDNGHTAFTVNESDIIQPTDSIATVKAYYNLSSGVPLWITFFLVKENGVWMIETIYLGNPDLGALTNFQIANFFPIVPGASYKFATFESGELSPSYDVKSFATTATSIGANNFYEFTDIYYPQASRRSLRANAGAPFLLIYGGPNTSFSLQDSGLWAHSINVNGGLPYKILETYHSFNSTHSFSITWLDSNSVSFNGTCTVSIGSPTSLETGLQTYSAVSLTFLTTYMSGTTEMVDKWVLWLAPGVGMVGADGYYPSTATSPTYQERIIEKVVNGVTTKNLPVISTSTLADVVTGSPMSPVTFSVSGGTSPYVWSLTTSSLPSGEFSFSSSGVLSGTPSTQGVYPFEVGLIDKYGRTSQKSFSLGVKSPSSTPTTGYIITATGVDSISMGSHYEKFYFVEPIEATTITNVSVQSYSPQQSIYPPWTGYDSFYNEWMLSFTPEIPGTYVFNMVVTTADGQTHQLRHDLTVTSSAVSKR